jgi:hypothetical protein
LATQDPFGDWDGDGYTNLQEMFEQSDPNDPFGLPAVPVATWTTRHGIDPRRRANPVAVPVAGPISQSRPVRVKSSADMGAPFDEVPAAGPLACSDRPTRGPDRVHAFVRLSFLPVVSDVAVKWFSGAAPATKNDRSLTPNESVRRPPVLKNNRARRSGPGESVDGLAMGYRGRGIAPKSERVLPFL